MPTGILQNKHLSRILSAMRQEEIRLEELYFKERLRRERRRPPESKHRTKPTARPRSGEEKRSSLSIYSLSKNPPELPKKPPPKDRKKITLLIAKIEEQQERDRILKDNGIIHRGGHVAVAMRQVLLDEGIPLGRHPRITFDSGIDGNGEYDHRTNTITLRCPMPKAIPYDPELSAAAAKERIRFAIAKFTGALFHEMRHFEQHWKSVVYLQSACPEELTPEHRQWFIEYGRDAILTERRDGDMTRMKIQKIVEDDYQMLATDLKRKAEKKQGRPEPLSYDAWKRALKDSETRERHLGQAYDIISKRKLRQRYPDSVANAVMKGKKCTDTPAYRHYMDQRNRDRKKEWIEKKFKKAHEDYKDNFEKLSGVTDTHLKLAMNISLYPQLHQPFRTFYLSSPIETDAHRANLSLVRRYLPGDQFLKFLQESEDIHSYNWIRKLIAQEDSKDKTLTALEV